MTLFSMEGMGMPCLFPGCPNEGRNNVGARCRVWHDEHPTKKKSDALWAPNSNGYICDEHASGGMHVTVLLEANDSDIVTLDVIARDEKTRETRRAQPRDVPIKG